MRDQLVVLDGSTFFASDPTGDVVGAGCEGFFFADTRHLSQWQLLVDGAPIEVLTAQNVDYYSARIVGRSRQPTDEDEQPLTIQRDRIVAGGVHEDVSVRNDTRHTRVVEVEIRFRADFADLFEIRDQPGMSRSPAVTVGSDQVTIAYENESFRRGTRLTFTEPGALGVDSACFEVELQSHQQWSMCIDVSCIDGDGEHGPRAGHGGFGQLHPQMTPALDEWIDEAPELDTDDCAIAETYRQCLLDLAALRFQPFAHDEISVPAAGLPWFMAIFGRDSLLASYMALPFRPELATATLETLARLQSSNDDPFRDAEPGKIPHELRRGELAQLGRVPHSPYFGSHDATPLFLVVLDEYERWTGDRALVHRLEPAARAALAWIEEWGDPDRDGYLEYRTRSPHGLVNQCWKDSPNSIQFADGRLAEPPIATCEIQGYAFDARNRTARLARTVWNDTELADRLEHDALALATRFDADFWCAERGHPALALDRAKSQVDALTSNIGHLLWSGILSQERARRVVDLLMSDELFTGWGVRSMASGNACFDPVEYHNGTVWPHDTALVAEGMRRYGFRDEASRLAHAVLESAAAFDHRLPEVFAGFTRSETTVPVPYPSASRPQAWSAAAPLLALRTMLGLDVVDGELRTEPHLPRAIKRLAVPNLHLDRRRRA